jgi:hypothetical protein
MKLAVTRADHDHFAEHFLDDETLATMNDIKTLESHIIYFSAGESKIKEVLVKRDPSYSV